MSSPTEAADLDEEFDRLQQELDAIANGISANEKNANGKDSCNAQAPEPNGHTQASEAVVVAAEAAATVNALPAWQQNLLERDLQEQNAAAALRTEALAISEQGEQKKGAAECVAGSTGVAGNVANATPQGKWVWNGARWEWKTVKPSTVDLAAITSANGQPQIGPSVQQHLSQTLIGPVGPGIQPSTITKAGASQKRPVKRMAAGEVWVDETLNEWPENDFRIFVGDLAPDAAEHELVDAFGKYKSFNMARIVKDKNSGKCRGYGFVSFASGEDMVAALKEMNGKYVGSRPVKLRKSNWQKRNLSGKRRKDLKLFRTIAKSSK